MGQPAAYSVLDLAPVRQDGSISDSYRNSLDLARHAERWGYQRFWMAEHHNMRGIASAATSVLLGHIAGGTSAIRVGSGGVMLPNHSALAIAEQFGTLEALYPGRIDLGLGRASGSDQATARALRRGAPPEKEEDFPRQVTELLGYLGPPAAAPAVRAIPGEGSNTPVWLLGSSTFSAQLAASLGLPFAFAAHFAPQLLMQALEDYRERFVPSARLEKPYAMVGIPVVAAPTEAEARRLATTPILRFLKLIRGGPIYLPAPIDPSAGENLMTSAEESLMRSKFAAAIIGGPEQVERQLSAFLESTGADELIFTSELYDHADRLRSYEIAAQAMRNAAAPAARQEIVSAIQ